MTERIYIAVGPHCWGKGDTSREAVKNMRRNVPTMLKGNGEFGVYSCHPESRVTEFGDLAYPKAEKPPVLVSRGNIGDTRQRRFQA